MAGPRQQDPKPGASEERATERRMVAASAVVQVASEVARDVADEDFLFHLYRGSELLQDNRVQEAKEELEQALTLQPRDPRGQELLAVGVLPRRPLPAGNPKSTNSSSATTRAIPPSSSTWRSAT